MSNPPYSDVDNERLLFKGITTVALVAICAMTSNFAAYIPAVIAVFLMWLTELIIATD